MQLNRAKNSSGKHSQRLFNTCIILLAATLTACGPSENETDKTDSSNITRQPPAVKYDSIPLDAAACEVSWLRNKTVKDVKKKIKFGNATMEVNMDEASFSADGTIPVISGAWFTRNDTFAGGIVRLNMRELKSLQVDASGQLDMNSPGYLDAEKYPYATIRFFETERHGVIETKGDSASGKAGNTIATSEIQAILTIKDKTDTIPMKGNITGYSKGIPETLNASFTIDGKVWGLNPKAAKVVKDEMRITLKLVTKNK